MIITYQHNIKMSTNYLSKKPKPPSAIEKEFCDKGIIAIEDLVKIRLSENMQHEIKQIHAIIAVPLNVYEGLLSSVFHKRPLLTGMTNGQNRALRYDQETRLFYTKNDNRLIAPIEMLYQHSPEEFKPTSNIGVQVLNKLKTGESPNVFHYDSNGVYDGVSTGEGVISPEQAKLRFKSHLCDVCSTPTKQLCSGCKAIYYCTIECQKKNYAAHKWWCKRTIIENGVVMLNDKNVDNSI
jgi:hypothetical protein